MMDVRCFRGADIGLTDHYLVVAKVRVKLMKTDKRKTLKAHPLKIYCSHILQSQCKCRFKLLLCNEDYGWWMRGECNVDRFDPKEEEEANGLDCM